MPCRTRVTTGTAQRIQQAAAETAATRCLQLGDESPDVEASTLAAAFNATQALLRRRLISAGHDISDGGIAVALLEMAFAGNTGIQV